MGKINFLDKKGTFSLKQPEHYSYLYFPIAGENGLKSAVTPNLNGDSKLNQNAFLMEPVSAENLHNNRSGRNFWCRMKEKGSWSVTGASAEAECARFTKEEDEVELTAGFMWQKTVRKSAKYQMEASVTIFAMPEYNAEIMHVQIKNNGTDATEVTPIAAIPIYGRSADNIRDHRHVTSLLHRIRTTENGVLVKPTLSFDERGHQKNHLTYYVCGVDEEGINPVSFYPTVEEYLGEGRSYTYPMAVAEDIPGVAAGTKREGTEAVGGLRFETISLPAGEGRGYTILLGATNREDEIAEILEKVDTKDKVKAQLKRVENYWQEQVNISYHTGSDAFDNYMRWVSFQPFLRRIFGCSFLPYHDYGKGGRGWRDLWQDCLALLMMNPSGVRQMILDNYGGVRIDGTNATIIGEKQGEFIADRNNITRVWMDHGVWPFMTTRLYIDQTGDIKLLTEPVVYFKDCQCERGTKKDEEWNDAYGKLQKSESGMVYKGSVLEHILLQHLCAFYEVGEHNFIRLRGADWNDALDMAEARGESVAFTCAYAGNLKEFAVYIRFLGREYGVKTLELLQEAEILLCTDETVFESVEEKHALLAEYLQKTRHEISGEKIILDTETLALNLEKKADWMMCHIRRSEWIDAPDGNGWFNGYYDNGGNAVEGFFGDNVRMMLTGQVFAIMSKTASREQAQKICASADRYLYDRKVGGYRINTNFEEEKYDLGRMFGFAYGEKENGAVFSHMTVMFANALYKNGFVEEGYKALQTLADTALDFDTSHIYPGVPEYFDAKGRGKYHYLTGAASWYMLTVVTEVFGVRGELGNLVLSPKLVADQFDKEGQASISLYFKGKAFTVRYKNPEHKNWGEYTLKRAVLDKNTELSFAGIQTVVKQKTIEALDNERHVIEVELG